MRCCEEGVMERNRRCFETGQVVLRLRCVDWWGSVVVKEGDFDGSEKLLKLESGSVLYS